MSFGVGYRNKVIQRVVLIDRRESETIDFFGNIPLAVILVHCGYAVLIDLLGKSTVRVVFESNVIAVRLLQLGNTSVFR